MATSTESSLKAIMSLSDAIAVFARRVQTYHPDDLDALVSFIEEDQYEIFKDAPQALELVKAVRDFRKRVVSIVSY